MVSARRASLLIGATLFVVMSAAFTYIYYSLNLETSPLVLAVAAVVTALVMAGLASLSVRLGLLVARHNPVRPRAVLAIALVYPAVLLVLGFMPDKGLEVVAPDSDFEIIAFELLQALVEVTLLPAFITYVVAFATRRVRHDA